MKSSIKFQKVPLKTLMVIVVIINLFACAANRPSDVSQAGPDPENTVAQQKESAASNPAKPLKSPHGYIIAQDYELGRFGGFIGDCTADQNWPYFWQCMSENSGNGGFK